jgi:hypothetical protein
MEFMKQLKLEKQPGAMAVFCNGYETTDEEAAWHLVCIKGLLHLKNNNINVSSFLH